MYYLIKKSDSRAEVDAVTLEIVTEAPRTNSSNEVRIEGWLGETDNISVTACGAYETEESARAAIAELFGEVREIEESEAVASFKIGAHEPLSAEATGNYVYEALKSDVLASTSDEDLQKLADDYRESALCEGWKLHDDLLEIMEQFRAEL